MPSAPLRSCATPGCRELVLRGHCTSHQQQRERRRGSAHQRGYSSYWHHTFRPYFIGVLVQRGIVPTCGAALPDGPRTSASRCQRDGRVTAMDLHLHHEPPLTDAERQDRLKVCDPLRIVLLCSACHRKLR